MPSIWVPPAALKSEIISPICDSVIISSHLDFGMGHVTCCIQWDDSQYCQSRASLSTSWMSLLFWKVFYSVRRVQTETGEAAKGRTVALWLAVSAPHPQPPSAKHGTRSAVVQICEKSRILFEATQCCSGLFLKKRLLSTRQRDSKPLSN